MQEFVEEEKVVTSFLFQLSPLTSPGTAREMQGTAYTNLMIPNYPAPRRINNLVEDSSLKLWQFTCSLKLSAGFLSDTIPSNSVQRFWPHTTGLNPKLNSSPWQQPWTDMTARTLLSVLLKGQIGILQPLQSQTQKYSSFDPALPGLPDAEPLTRACPLKWLLENT